MPKPVFLAGVGVVLVALAFVVTHGVLFAGGGTEANYNRITKGMTRGQVEALLGGRGRFAVSFEPDDARFEGWATWIWRGEDGDAWVTFTRSGRVRNAYFYRAAKPPSLLDHLRGLVER
jgi:hypothetical protein